MRGAVAGGQAGGWRGSAAARYALAQVRWLRWLAGRLGDSARAALATLADQWRRSLQLRVITATFLVSCLVVVVLGFVLMQEIAQNIVTSKENTAQNVASVGLSV